MTIINNLNVDELEQIKKASYEQGRADRDKELAEHNVFCSNRPIEDIVLEAIADERERIVKELEKEIIESVVVFDKVEIEDEDLFFNQGIRRAIEIVKRGGKND